MSESYKDRRLRELTNKTRKPRASRLPNLAESEDRGAYVVFKPAPPDPKTAEIVFPEPVPDPEPDAPSPQEPPGAPERPAPAPEPPSPSGAATQTCERCGETKLSYKHFGRRNVQGQGVYMTVCKACFQAEKNAHERSLERKTAERLQAQAQAAQAKRDAAAEAERLRRLEEQELRRIARRRVKDAAAQLEKSPEELELERRRVAEAVAKSKEKALAKTLEQDAEMARRVLARRRLIEFTKRFHPSYSAGWVHRDVCRRLEKFLQDVVEQKAPRLMLFMPPRHGKSQLASINFPAWALGHHPELEIISSSYAVSLPIGFSRKVRELLQDPAYKALFPKTQLDKNIASAETWATTMGGGFIASGVGTGITGKGYHIGIIDDPIKDAEEADSETIREKAWDWFSSTFYTRAAPGAGILVILTRWHDDDLAGRLLAQMKQEIEEGVDPEPWEVIQYPAVATTDEFVNADGTITDAPKAEGSIQVRRKGEALHEERFPLERLERIKRTLQPRHFSALYQQNPVPDEGSYFTKDMFRFNSQPPPTHTLRMFAAWDLAIGEKQVNDWTVGVIGGLDYQDQLFIVDVLRFRGDSYKIAEAIVTSANRWQVELVGIEKGQLEQAIRPILLKVMKEKRATFALAEGDKALVPVTDKLSRARPLQGRLQQGMIYFDSAQPWCEKLIEEALRFPAGVHDDQVDALAWLTRLVMREDPPKPPRRKAAKTLQSKLQAILAGAQELTPMAA